MRGRLASLFLLSILFPFTLSAETVRISGRVLDAREPFAGARVELYPAASVYEDALRQLAGQAPVPLRSTRTGPDGTFELLAPESGAYRVVVQAKDRLALEHLVVPLIEEISLLPAELIRPATITIFHAGSQKERSTDFRTTSDATGRNRVRHRRRGCLPPSESCRATEEPARRSVARP